MNDAALQERQESMRELFIAQMSRDIQRIRCAEARHLRARLACQAAADAEADKSIADARANAARHIAALKAVAGVARAEASLDRERITAARLEFSDAIEALEHASRNLGATHRLADSHADQANFTGDMQDEMFTQRIGWQIRGKKGNDQWGMWLTAEAYQIRAYLQRPNPSFQFRPIYAGGIAEPVLVEAEQETRP